MLKIFVYHNILVKATRSTRTQYLRGQNALILSKEKPMQKKNCFIIVLLKQGYSLIQKMTKEREG